LDNVGLLTDEPVCLDHLENRFSMQQYLGIFEISPYISHAMVGISFDSSQFLLGQNRLIPNLPL